MTPFKDICTRMFSRYLITALILLSSIHSKAQLCQGSLGDPLINISFGSGSNPGTALAAAATGYQFVSGDCPSDGFYTVRNSTSSCFFNSWHSLTSDHTGNGNGYFMLVNASIQPSAFYVDTVRGLCGSSTYEFAAWIMNVILPSACNGNTNQPNLTFTIERTDGTVLQTYNSGNIAPSTSPIWKQYGFFFTTPGAGVDIVLRIVNNAPGGCGNDIALDDITFRPCGPQLTPSISGLSGITPSICQGSTRTFNFNCDISAGFTNPVFQWQHRFNNAPWSDIPAANATTLTRNFIPSDVVGRYEYRLSVAEAGNLGSAQCRISSFPVAVLVNPNPVVTASNTGPVCEGNDITLTAGGGTQYLWTGPNGYSANAAVVTIPQLSLSQAGTYNVTVSSDARCSSPGSTNVIVNPAPVAIVPFADTAVCIGKNVQLSASGGINYEWQPAEGLSSSDIFNPLSSPVTDTRYMVVASNNFLCKDTAYINVRVYDKAIANAGPDKTIILGGTATLDASIEGPYLSFTWDPLDDLDNPFLLQPVSMPSADARYILTALSKNNCGTSADTVFVKLYKGIFIPNAFTPNNDTKNDTWNIPALDAYPNFELFVFNRYGEIVFKNSKKRTPWDGSYKSNPLPTGAYPYLIKLNVSGQVLKGTVMIIH